MASQIKAQLVLNKHEYDANKNSKIRENPMLSKYEIVPCSVNTR